LNDGNKIDIVIIRHGQTPDNVADSEFYIELDGTRQVSQGLVISGHNEVTLTQHGAMQCIDGARAVVSYVQSLGYTSYAEFERFCSDLPRTVQTEAFFVTGMGDFTQATDEPKYRTELRERNAGVWQGALRASALEQDPSIALAFEDASYRYAGGESLVDRGTIAGEFVVGAARQGRPMFVYAHEITNIGLLDYLLRGRVSDSAWQFKGLVKNAGFFHVRFNLDTQRGEVMDHS